ncbi:MAG: hypothetical protein H7326_04470 [Bdellovibrionaceae bacterium]|nr:hypothetical protein [Pseudobdellovibrionaceae bacterium]
MSKVKSFWYLIIILVLGYAVPGFAKIDESVDIFFPKSLKYLQYSQTEFPVFWWNFVVINPVGGEAQFVKARAVCQTLQKYEAKSIQRLVCGDQLGGFVQTLDLWSQDLVLREDYAKDPALYRDAIQRSVSDLSFLSTSQKEIFKLKRSDPTDQWQIYLAKSQAMSPSSFERTQGFLLDPKTRRLVIPIQFSVPPKMQQVEDLMSDLQQYGGVHLVGAHGSAYANEKQVHADLKIVSIVGAVVLVGFILFLVLKGSVGALLLFPPVAVALTLAAWMTELFYGSIHGLTLAFGSGIVGLAVDYGMHGAFNAGSKQTWKSNAVGFVTTFIALGILAFSGIPLIRQMMVFGSLGLLFGFVFFYLLCKYVPKYFRLKSIRFYFPDFRYSWIVIVVLVVWGLLGAAKVDLNFDLRRFNFQTPGDAEATNWFFSQGEASETYILLHEPEEIYTATTEEFRWSEENRIKYVGLGQLIPSAEVQAKNLESWSTRGCGELSKSSNATELKLFTPFFKNICETGRAPLQFAEMQKRDYMSPLIGSKNFVSLFFAANPAQEKAILEKFPESHSLVESIRGFSKSLEEDMRWMIPSAIIICGIILLIYYRSLFFMAAAFVPFMSGLGVFFFATSLTGGSLDLISVLGLLMVFGFSVDYGVFVTDIYAFPETEEDPQIIYSVLGLAAMTNIIGFFPMVFAEHPILHQLGVALFYGTIGTYLGTRWGLGPFLSLRPKSKKRSA